VVSLRGAGGGRLRPTPHATTFGRVLAAVDPVALQRALTGWVLSRREGRRRQHADGGRSRGEDRAVLAVDGKTLRVRHEVACGEWITAEEVP
jgi:hypothetical protein